MTGSEHYKRAENFARAAESILDRATPNTYEDAQRQASALAAIAQVHATLALTAATFIGGGAGLAADSDTAHQWRAVTIL